MRDGAAPKRSSPQQQPFTQTKSWPSCRATLTSLPSGLVTMLRVARGREIVTANGGSIVGEEYFPLDHADYGATIAKIMSGGTDVVFNMTVPPGVVPFLEQLHDAGFTRRGGLIVCTYFDENLVSLLPSAHVEGLYGCLDYYQAVGDSYVAVELCQGHGPPAYSAGGWVNGVGVSCRYGVV